MKSLMITLIHNNQTLRLTKSRQQVEYLVAGLENYDVSVEEISFQTHLPISLPETTIRQRYELQAKVQKEWLDYREIVESEDEIDLLPVTLNLDRVGVELTLSDKHIRSWDLFLESDKDILLCMEDDVFLRSSSLQEFYWLLDQLSQLNPLAFYIDIAGGFPIEPLRVNALVGSTKGRIVSFKRPVTNTTCCYLINRYLAQTLKSLIIRHPEFRLLPADWLLNKLFIEIAKTEQQIFCLHFFPPMFVHGSISGIYNSMITH